MLDAIRVSALAWKDIVDFIKSNDQPFGEELGTFYERCLTFNRAVKANDRDYAKANAKS